MTYTPESHTVYYGSDGSCSLSGTDLKKFNRSRTTYTPNNQTLTGFFFEKDSNFSIEIVGLTPSTHYCCFVVATNSHVSTRSEPVSFETKTDTDKTGTTDTADTTNMTNATATTDTTGKTDVLDCIKQGFGSEKH